MRPHSAVPVEYAPLFVILRVVEGLDHAAQPVHYGTWQTKSVQHLSQRLNRQLPLLLQLARQTTTREDAGEGSFAVKTEHVPHRGRVRILLARKDFHLSVTRAAQQAQHALRGKADINVYKQAHALWVLRVLRRVRVKVRIP